MADFKTMTEFTIADRLSSQLKQELTISEITEKAARLEEELLKFKTDIDAKVDGKNGKYSIDVTVNGASKAIEFSNADIEHYLGSSNPSHQITVEALEVLIDPYRSMLYAELAKIIGPIVSNYQDIKAGRKL